MRREVKFHPLGNKYECNSLLRHKVRKNHRPDRISFRDLGCEDGLVSTIEVLNNQLRLLSARELCNITGFPLFRTDKIP